MAVELQVDVEFHKQVAHDPDGKFVNGRVTLSSSVHLETGVDVPEDLMAEFPKVNLSRYGQNPDCNFSLCSLAQHDGHAPGFNTEEAMQVYVDRVTADIGKATEQAEIIVADWFHPFVADEETVEELEAGGLSGLTIEGNEED
jgi:hypothetical protein